MKIVMNLTSYLQPRFDQTDLRRYHSIVIEIGFQS